MELLSTRFSPSVPTAVAIPVLAVTVQVVPLPTTAVMAEPVTVPVAANEKSLASTPVTASLNNTVQETLLAPVGLPKSRVIDVTVGGVVS